MNSDLLLLPPPRELVVQPRSLTLRAMPRFELAVPDAGLRERLHARLLQSLREHARLATSAPDAPLLRVDLARAPALPAEGFELTIDATGIRLSAGDPRGLLHATGALEQILLQRGAELPELRLRDWPEFQVRGFMLDISRDRVPTMETLGLLVGLMATLRLNQLQLYTEHTFAYAGHEPVWRDASPMTPDELRALDELCAQHGIELVPNQNSFGHMERWLRHPPYRQLAESPDGGACLAPGPEAIEFMRGLYAELLPCFRSRTINIDCDETFQLGSGRSREACEARGRGRVYLEFLLELIAGLHAQGRHVQFWGDIIAQHPELIGELPDREITALAWGYEAPLDPSSLPEQVRQVFGRFSDLEELRGFERRARPFAASGVPFFVCPGTSSWNSLIGRWPNARANLLDAAVAGRAHGASGYLITDWGDNGHLQPLSTSLLPLCFGAVAAWHADAAEALDLERALNVLVLRDETRESARALLRLGTLGDQSGLHALNASPLFLGLIRPLAANLLVWGETDLARLESVVSAIDEERTRLERARPRGFGGAIVARELRQAAGLARHGAWRLARGRLGLGPENPALRADLEALVEEQATTWRARSREGGLSDSLARLRNALADYG